MEGQYFINGKDAFLTYGLVFRKKTYAQLLRRPKKKEILSKNWPDQHGEQRFFPATPFFESITYQIPVYHRGFSEADFYAKYNALDTFIQTTPGYFDFDVIGMNRRFRVFYDDMPDLDKLTVIKGNNNIYCASTLTLINDFPTLKISPAEDVMNKFIANVTADGGITDKDLLLLNF